MIPALACSGSGDPTSTPQISTATSEDAEEVEEPTQEEETEQQEEAELEEEGETEEAVEDESTEEPTQEPTEEPTPEPTNTPEPQVALLGDLVEQDGYSFVAFAVADPAPPGLFYEEIDGQRLVAIEVSVGNVSADTFSSNVLNATLVDSDGFTYQPELGAGEDQLELIEVQPGERVRGWVPFQIPEESVPNIIKYEFSGVPEIELQSELLTANGESVFIGEVPLTAGEEPVFEGANLGDLVEQDGYSFVAEVLEDPTTNFSILYEPKEGKKLVAVQIVVGNVDAEELTVNPLNAFLIDDQDFLYVVELGGRNEQIELSDLGPGERVRGWVSFSIPEDATPDRIKYQMTGFPLIELYSGLDTGDSAAAPTGESETDGGVTGEENTEEVEAASSGDVALETYILGKWTGLQTSVSGDKVPATWEFLNGGVMVISIAEFTFGGTWALDGNRINITTEANPDAPTYRDVEIISEDVMRLTKAESDIVETWSRVNE